MAQRIVSLFETLARKHARLVDGLETVADEVQEEGFDEVSEAVHGLGASPAEASAWWRPASPQAPGGEEPPQGEGALRLRGRRRGRGHYQGGRCL